MRAANQSNLDQNRLGGLAFRVCRVLPSAHAGFSLCVRNLLTLADFFFLFSFFLNCGQLFVKVNGRPLSFPILSLLLLLFPFLRGQHKAETVSALALTPGLYLCVHVSFSFIDLIWRESRSRWQLFLTSH